MSEVTVVTDALHDESDKWTGLAGKLKPIASAVDQLYLGPLAFFAGPSPDFVAHSLAYDKFQDAIAKVLDEGVVEFEQLAVVLGRIADNYDGADSQNAQDLDKIYSV